MLTDLHVSFIYTFNKHSGSTKYSGAYKTDDGFSPTVTLVLRHLMNQKMCCHGD